MHGGHPGAVLQQGDLGDELLVHAVIEQGHQHQPQQQDHQEAQQQQRQSEAGLRELEAAPLQQPGHPEGPREHEQHHQQRDRQQGGQGDPGPEHPAESRAIPAQQAAQGGTFPRQGLPGAADHAHIPPAAHRQAGGQAHQEQQPVANPQGLAPGSPQHLLLKRLQQDLQPREQQGEEHETPGSPAERGPAVVDGIADVQPLDGGPAEASAAGGHHQNAWNYKAREGGEARPLPRLRR